MGNINVKWDPSLAVDEPKASSVPKYNSNNQLLSADPDITDESNIVATTGWVGTKVRKDIFDVFESLIWRKAFVNNDHYTIIHISNGTFLLILRNSERTLFNIMDSENGELIWEFSYGDEYQVESYMEAYKCILISFTGREGIMQIKYSGYGAESQYSVSNFAGGFSGTKFYTTSQSDIISKPRVYTLEKNRWSDDDGIVEGSFICEYNIVGIAYTELTDKVLCESDASSLCYTLGSSIYGDEIYVCGSLYATKYTVRTIDGSTSLYYPDNIPYGSITTYPTHSCVVKSKQYKYLYVTDGTNIDCIDLDDNSIATSLTFDNTVTDMHILDNNDILIVTTTENFDSDNKGIIIYRYDPSLKYLRFQQSFTEFPISSTSKGRVSFDYVDNKLYTIMPGESNIDKYILYEDVPSVLRNIHNKCDDIADIIKKVPIENGGTGAITSEEARTNLGIVQGIPVVNGTSEDGITYTATVDSISELTMGTSIWFIPNMDSHTIIPQLNINNLGAKTLYRGVSDGTSGGGGPRNAWIAQNKAHLLIYGGSSWYVMNLTQPSATDLKGIVPIENGGTGASTVAEARTNLEITPDNIGAMPVYTHTTSISFNSDELKAFGVHYCNFTHIAGDEYNPPVSNWGVVISYSNAGTPFQMFYPDSASIIYKRKLSEKTWVPMGGHTYGTTDLTSGSSALLTGQLYLVYE